jgi:hypothetical protein
LIRAASLQREASADLYGDLAIRDGIGVFQPQGAALIEVRVVSVDEETVVQLNNIGPCVITYIDPKDDAPEAKVTCAGRSGGQPGERTRHERDLQVLTRFALLERTCDRKALSGEARDISLPKEARTND